MCVSAFSYDSHDMIFLVESEGPTDNVFPFQITRGREYIHQRNPKINLILTAVAIIFLALGLGLGIGHFLGWSERLELQEMYAEVREDRMEELTDSLVSCMTGEEAAGGDDQDLDDRVIQQLHEENRELKEQVELLHQMNAAANSPERRVEEGEELRSDTALCTIFDNYKIHMDTIFILMQPIAWVKPHSREQFQTAGLNSWVK